ncbi:MAG: cyclic pyranopterin phosphate synthase [Candidatus Sericytochromatia bacterium]|nr:MAG: cyclic pyranopterin phosphate synthase [Candidatus Sericytochromatia bacterium]
MNTEVRVKENKLIDSYQRLIHKLRVQLTDACNFRCFYCMPLDMKFKPHSELLTSEEIYQICFILNQDFGIDELRITGGEPTIRPEFEEIVYKLSSLNLSKLGLTTNGFILDKKLDFLKTTECKNINISLDSLNEETFNYITRSKYFKNTLKSILKAKELGFNIKINTVMLKGINDNEVEEFINFSAKYDIEVRFLELMKIGEAYYNNDKLFISAKEYIDKIKKKHNLHPIKVEIDSTSFKYRLENGAKIGFIASESMPFCNSCSRLRLSATGKLRSCLMSNNGINLKNLQKEQYREVLYSVISMKPYTRIHHIEENMNQIGG